MGEAFTSDERSHSGRNLFSFLSRHN
uniref:Uncharacterized protein n=1 Tax=Anguilla anguilla TaxID=7936 RepID=A0A0E9UTL5_ANGAN